MADVVFLNGTVGAGKSTVAEAIAAQEKAAGTPHAVIDVDEIRRSWPSPPGDRFNLELQLRNLRALVDNYRAAGALHFVVAGVIEDADAVPGFADAVGSSDILVVRLAASPETIVARLGRRHADDHAALKWHLLRAPELAEILDATGLDDLVIDTTGVTPADIATRIRAAARW